MSHPSTMKSPPQGHAASFKEVRFSHPLVPLRRARSVASSRISLDSAFQAARAAEKARADNTYKDQAKYIDHSRSLLESHRLHFERERQLFAEERRLWDIERTILKSRIAELEAAAGVQNTQSFMNQFRPSFTFDGSNSSNTGLWQPNESTGSVFKKQQHHVWEGPLPGSRRPTRVFPDDDKPDMTKNNLYLAPTEANGFGLRNSLDAALSPHYDRTGQVSMPVPIEKVDSQLDGITLKSTALPPEVVAKVMTPPTSISPTSSPPKNQPDNSKQTPDGKSPMKLDLSELGPPDANLTRHAGHTPMAILGTETFSTETEVSRQSPKELSLGQIEEDFEDEEAPLEPVVTKQPVESGDSYFPVIADDDPALKGPLTLENNESKDSAFLLQLDQKLLDEAKKAIGGSFAAEEETSQDDLADGGNESDPELKLKPSTNFGTAFGQC